MEDEDHAHSPVTKSNEQDQDDVDRAQKTPDYLHAPAEEMSDRKSKKSKKDKSERSRSRKDKSQADDSLSQPQVI